MTDRRVSMPERHSPSFELQAILTRRPTSTTVSMPERHSPSFEPTHGEAVQA